VIQTGRHLRDEGMARALQSEEQWKADYNRLLQRWFASRPDGFKFTGETLGIAARALGLEEPHSHKCWGSAASRIEFGWRREGKMRDTGRLVAAKNPKTRAHKIPEYEKIVARRYQFAKPENQMELLA
jgi:hypothetical protein